MLLAAAFSATASTDRAPNLHFERIGTAEGPLPAVITALHQDRDGLIWIGSRNGLTVFDAYRFSTFQHDPGNSGSLSDNSIRTIYEDQDGTLWFGTNTGGLDRFDPATRSFIHYRHDSADPRSLSHDSVYAILRDRRGRLWVGTQKGLNRLEPESGGFVHILAGGAEGMISDYVLTLYEDRGGRIWVGTLDGGLLLWDDESGRFKVFRNDPASASSLVDDRVFALLEDDAGRLWVGTSAGLCRLEPDGKTFFRAEGAADAPRRREDLMVTSLAAGERGRMWVGTHGGGLAAVDTATGRMSYWRHETGREGSLSDDMIIALLSDRAGALWIGTWGGGLNRLSAAAQRYAGPGGPGFPPAILNGRSVTCLLHDRRGTIWIGTRTGYLARLDPETGRSETILRGGSEGVAQTFVALEEDRLGQIWIGTSGALIRLDPRTLETKEWEHRADDPRSLGPGFVTAVLEDRSGHLWVGTGEGGLQMLDRDAKVLQRFVHDPNDPSSLSDDYVTALLEDRSGVLWVGTRSGGLNEIDPATGRARRFLPVAGDPSSIGHHFVTSLLQDSRGRLWVGTSGGGLNRIERSSDGGVRFVRVTEHEGLIDDDVTGLVEDDDGSLWVTTRRGLSRFQPERNAFTNVLVSDGLPSAEFESGAAARSRGWLFFGTVSGLAALPAGTEFRDPSPSPVVMRSIRTASGELLDRQMSRDPGPVKIPYGTWMSIELAVLDYSTELDRRYAYRLRGDWVDIGDRREITFTSLEPGAQTLRVRGRNSQGVWAEAGAPLHIEVVPPLWMTMRFRLLVTAAIVALAFGAHLRRTSVLEKRHRALLELQQQRERARKDLDDAYQRLRGLTRRLEVAKEDERQRIARELHDEMGPSLTAVIINLRLLPAQRSPEQLARRIDDTVDLVDSMIQRIRDISLDLRPPLIDELGLVPALGGYLESVSERTGIKINLRGDRDLGSLPVHVPITAFRVVQESVTNAVRHAGADTIEIMVRRNGAGLELSVEDDGKGFVVEETMDRVAAGKAIGLLGMQERVGMLGGELEIDSTPGEGTRIHVRLPFSETA